ncbi:MAG: hypothetical protein RL011_347 [Pseudomonadota bacterium]
MNSLLKNAVIIFTCFLSSSVVRAEDVAIEHLKITVDAKASRKVPKDQSKGYSKDWKKTCSALGSAMTVGNGPFGFGAFGSFSCYLSGKKVSGVDKPTTWSLNVVDGVKEVKYQLIHQDDKVSDVVSEYVLPHSDHLMKFYKDDEYIDYVAYALLEGSPMGMLVSKARIKGSPPSFTGRYWRAGKSRSFKYPEQEAPKSLVLYRLSWDSAQKQWSSQVVGIANRTKINKPKSKKVKKKSVLAGGDVTYEITPAIDAVLATGPLWAQSADGPGTRKSEIIKGLSAAHADLDRAVEKDVLDDFLTGGKDFLGQLWEAAASGYVGLRYGKQILPGVGPLGTLLAKTNMFGLLFEMRGGPLKGLRYYYDVLPKSTQTLDGIDLNGLDTTYTASIAFARHVIGFSWDFNPGFLVDRVTIDPKLGLWTFNASLPVAMNENKKVIEMADFSLGRSFALGLELGLEQLSDWYTIRGWFGINTGYSLIKSGGKVTSNRLGVDAYFTAGPELPLLGLRLRTALLAFYFWESVGLTNTTVKAADSDPAAISGVSYDVGYAGAGIALSW